MTEQEIAELAKQINDHRGSGFIHLRYQTLSERTTDPLYVIKGQAQAWGFKSYPTLEVTRDRARRIAELILKKDLACGADSIPKEYAGSYVDRFFAWFDNNSRYFTNSRSLDDGGVLSGWNPITDATFDTGVFISDSKGIGVIWAEDED